VGGYFLAQESPGRGPMLLLAGGLTLAIPTTVAVLSATAYEPPATYIQDQGPADEPVADPPKGVPAPGAAPAPGPTTPTGRAPTRRHIVTKIPRRVVPSALIDLEPERLTLSVPAVEVREVHTRAEVAMGAPQATEVRIPVLNVLF
jgi:hypothetical protein